MNKFLNLSSVNQEKQQQINRSLVIDLLRQEKLCSRANLAKLSGLNRATITNIINEFIEKGLVIEDGLLESDKGRRSIGIRINGQMYRVIGVMVTRKYYCISLMGLSGKVFDVKTFNISEGTSVLSVISSIKNNIHRMISENKGSEILAIGIALPGPYKMEEGEIVFVTNAIGWDGFPIYSAFQEGFDIPVFVENDANAAVHAQLWYRGKKTDQRNIVYIVAGQGIGCGIISDSKILRGAIGIAGELGHTSINFDGPQCECGNKGCLETYCSIIVLEKNIRARIQSGEETQLPLDFTTDDLKKAVMENDKIAVEEYSKTCEFLALGIVNMINQINPDDVIIGDLLSEINPKMFLNIVKSTVTGIVRPIIRDNLKIELNSIIYNPIMIGAGVIAAQNVFYNPYKFIKAK